MRHLLISVLICTCFACGQDCSECEEKLKECSMAEPVPVDLPTSNNDPFENQGSDFIMEVEVNADNQYFVEGREISWESLQDELDRRLRGREDDQNNMKIVADKMAHWDAVFQLINLSKEKNVSPVLASSI